MSSTCSRSGDTTSSRCRGQAAWTCSPVTAWRTPLEGVECIIDVATGFSPDREAATAFFTAAARNLQEAGERAGVPSRRAS